ncbi:hypothetical protein [Nocardia speluncae]|nr:hypothetical protein [Nocardia speluncae]
MGDRRTVTARDRGYDPAGLDVAAIRPIRAEIETRVRALLAELDVPIV